MTAFYKKRLRTYHTQLLKYLKYVFNDHLVLALAFILGGLGLYYSDFVKSLTPDFKMAYLIVWLVLLLALHIGKLATLIKPADKTFLLPKEGDMTQYLLASYRQSLIMPGFILALVVFITSPLLMVVQPNLPLWVLPLIYVTVAGLKMIHLHTCLLQCYNQTTVSPRLAYGLWFFGSCLLLGIALWQPILASGLTVLLVIISSRWIHQFQQQHFLNWETLINVENSRLNRIYRFINLFTDVPGIQSPAKRRKYLDPLLTHIKPIQSHTFDYLYTRHFLRGSDYAGLVFRLLIIGILALSFIKTPILAMGLALLLVFLIGFQLLPLINSFSYISATQLYPVTISEKELALGRLIQKILFVTVLVFSLVAIIRFQDRLMAVLLIPLLVIECIIFTKIYLPHRLKKMANF